MRKPCCEKEETSKGAWSKQEDQKLIRYISTYGEGSWRSLPKAAGLDRCGKSCRLRWINYLRPDIKRGNFGSDEEDLIIKLHALLGNRWSLIAGRLPGRTDNEVKNYWNSHVSKKLIKMGIDPNNHRLHQINNKLRPRVLLSDNQKVYSINKSATSCGSMNNASKVVPFKCDDQNDRASEAASSCLVEDHETYSVQLNLDLSIAFPSSSLKIDGAGREIKHQDL